MTTGKTIALTRRTFVGKVMSLLFNMLSRLVITFLPRSKRLLISWLQSPSAVILEPRKIKSATVSTVSPSICHEVMGLDTRFLKPPFKQVLLLSSICCKELESREGDSLSTDLTASEGHSQDCWTPESERLASLLYHVFPGTQQWHGPISIPSQNTKNKPCPHPLTPCKDGAFPHILRPCAYSIEGTWELGGHPRLWVGDLS